MILGHFTATAAKRGRNPRFPYVPVVVYHPADNSRGYTVQPRATRDEAIAYAEQYIAVNHMNEESR